MARTGWAIADLDAAISTISQRLVNSASAGSTDVCGQGISPAIIEELGTIVELSDLVSKLAADLLPLWGNIQARGPNSLYQKICFTAAADKTGEAVFRIPASESRITALPLRDECFRQFCAFLRMDWKIYARRQARPALGLVCR
jgi:hypothetical protein